MQRRDFAQIIGLSLASTPFISVKSPLKRTPSQEKSPELETIIPPPLRKGDTIGLISPASNADDERVDKAISNLQAMGLKVIEGNFLREKHGFIAGTDKQRLDDLHNMYKNPDIDAIWCVRGGYGTTRIISDIDYSLIRKNPKALIGYSDITALHLAIFAKAGVVGFHGPVASSTMTDYAQSNINKVLFRKNLEVNIKPVSDVEPPLQAPFILHHGNAHGRLLGGNLSLMAALCGTEYLPDFTDAIVFIEDVGEKTYSIDRMLVQLFQATNIRKASGIILGQFKGCKPADGDQSLLETLKMHFMDLSIPTIGGFSVGHVADQTVMPVGIHAHMKSSAYSLNFYFD